jgi:hypothetical protein
MPDSLFLGDRAKARAVWRQAIEIEWDLSGRYVDPRLSNL